MVAEKSTENEPIEDKAPEGETEGQNNNGSTEEKKDDDHQEPQSSSKDRESEELVKEDPPNAGVDANPGPKTEEKEPVKMEEDDQANGPTLQVSVANTPDIEGNGDNDADGDDADDVDDQAGPTLQFTFQQNTDDVPDVEIENEKPTTIGKKRSRSEKTEGVKEEEFHLLNTHVEYEDKDPQTIVDKKIISECKPESDLEMALARLLEKKENHVEKLTNEIKKLKGFISKRKQTYKRKRKDEGAPTRALSAYNIFVQDQFAKLSKKNSAALQSADTNAQLERVPPANLVASTGGRWKKLSEEEKKQYRDRAGTDRKRYEKQMAKYQPPDKAGNRKRNKTGYNMFFSAHVLRLKQSELGVPSERGSVARLVGTAWKQLNAEEKQYYEREADKHNGMNPVEKVDDDDKEVEESKETARTQQQTTQQQQAATAQVQDPYAAHAAAQYAGHDLSTTAGYAHAMHQAAQQHDPRVAAAAHHGYYYAHAQPHAAHAYHYDYSGHHAQQQAQQQQHSRASRGQYQYGQQPHGYYEK